MTLEEIKRLGKDKAKAQKAAIYKEADAFAYMVPTININPVSGAPTSATKQAEPIKDYAEKDSIKVKCVINACGIIDSHNDLHLKGIWNDQIKTGQTGTVKHLQEHKRSFDAVISSGADLTVKTQSISWSELGLKYDGNTECLVFESNVRKERNPFMFDQYGKGQVDNHSVGMRYGEIELCVNSEDKYWKEEKENWDTYIKEAVNPEAAEKQGYFWAVKSATFSEGSAVVFGSNPATPTTEAKADLDDFGEEKDQITNENEREVDAQKLRARRLALLKVKD